MDARGIGIAIGIAAGVAGAVAAVSWASSDRTPGERAALEPRSSQGPERDVTDGADRLVEAPDWPAHVRWIGIGGGSHPELNQISLEEDLLGIREALGEGGVVLFAGGPGTRAVQVQDDASRGDPLRRALGDLLAWRGGRDARYQRARLTPHGPATAAALADALSFALADGSDPLVLWIAAHGDRGEVPADATVLLWAGSSLDPAAVEETITMSGTRRRLQLVITSCYAGGFAELAFDGLDPDRGPTPRDVCGVFATSWDEESSGCDPSRDRAAQEAYSIHLIEALRGLDRRGRDVRVELDLDGDGAVSLLEAHARARADALSVDVPTTTSTRLLRALAPVDGPRVEVALPEEDVVLRRIGGRLRITGPEDARTRLDALALRRVELEGAIERERSRADDLAWAVIGALLSRWPEIDDPWHPDFDATLATQGSAIRGFLEASREHAAWEQVQEDVIAMEHTLAALRIESAPIRRWLEAHETVELAARLRAAGGETWERYQRMRTCEAGRP